MTLAKIKYLSNTYFKFDFVKRAGWNRRAGGNFFSKSINVQTKIRPCRGEFFPQKHSQNTPNGNNKKNFQSTSEVFPNHSQNHSKNTTKPLPNRAEYTHAIL